MKLAIYSLAAPMAIRAVDICHSDFFTRFQETIENSQLGDKVDVSSLALTFNLPFAYIEHGFNANNDEMLIDAYDYFFELVGEIFALQDNVPVLSIALNMLNGGADVFQTFLLDSHNYALANSGSDSESGALMVSGTSWENLNKFRSDYLLDVIDYWDFDTLMQFKDDHVSPHFAKLADFIDEHYWEIIFFDERQNTMMMYEIFGQFDDKADEYVSENGGEDAIAARLEAVAGSIISAIVSDFGIEDADDLMSQMTPNSQYGFRAYRLFDDISSSDFFRFSPGAFLNIRPHWGDKSAAAVAYDQKYDNITSAWDVFEVVLESSNVEARCEDRVPQSEIEEDFNEMKQLFCVDGNSVYACRSYYTVENIYTMRHAAFVHPHDCQLAINNAFKGEDFEQAYDTARDNLRQVIDITHEYLENFELPEICAEPQSYSYQDGIDDWDTFNWDKYYEERDARRACDSEAKNPGQESIDRAVENFAIQKKVHKKINGCL